MVYMSTEQIVHQLITGLQSTTWLEYIGVACGISSVWFSKKEHILVYPVGMINTIIYVYLCIKGHLLGEASVNIYYTIISIYGWILWLRKDHQAQTILRITRSSRQEWLSTLVFFGACWLVLYIALYYARQYFAPGAIPLADSFSAASAYTGMWLMAKKKIENWFWWLLTDLASMPLYFIKEYVFTSVQFLVFTILAISGWIEWHHKLNAQPVKTSHA